MDLQKELKISKFESAYQQAIVNVFFTYTWCHTQMKKTMSPYDITTQQFNILRILRGQNPTACSVNTLKDRMLDKMSDASRIVDRLVQKGLVMKSTSVTDKRSVDVVITRKGLLLLKQIDLEVDLSAMVAPNLSIEEATQLNILLDKLRG
jgi:DNA-binding MarR family transcriptional regulator